MMLKHKKTGPTALFTGLRNRRKPKMALSRGRCGVMTAVIMASGRITRSMGLVFNIMKIKTGMKGVGKTICAMEKVDTLLYIQILTI